MALCLPNEMRSITSPRSPFPPSIQPERATPSSAAWRFFSLAASNIRKPSLAPTSTPLFPRSQSARKSPLSLFKSSKPNGKNLDRANHAHRQENDGRDQRQRSMHRDAQHSKWQ